MKINFHILLFEKNVGETRDDCYKG